MNTFTFSLLTAGLLTLMSCGQSAEEKAERKRKSDSTAEACFLSSRPPQTEPGSLLFPSQAKRDSNNWWHCPDAIKEFPPIEIGSWNKVPVVTGRLKLQDVLGLIHYDQMINLHAKPYNMTLPKLAFFYCPYTKRQETVVVVQIVQTEKDTVVGYRYLTGGVGTYNFRNFHFLTDDEIKKVSGQ